MSRSWRRQRAQIFEQARRDEGPLTLPERARAEAAPEPEPVAEAPPAPEPEIVAAEPPEPEIVAAEPPAPEPEADPSVEVANLLGEWDEEPEEAVAGATRRPEPRSRRSSRRRRPVSGPDLVGSDFLQKPAPRAARRRPSLLAPLASGVLGALLLLAALHLDLIRLEYAQGKALREETKLSQDLAQLVVDERGSRDPAELHRHAEEMGLGVAEQVIELPLRLAGRPESR